MICHEKNIWLVPIFQPSYPALPTLLPTADQDPNQSRLPTPDQSPPKKRAKSAIDDIFGDVFITSVEPATKASLLQRAEQEVKTYCDSFPCIPLTDNPLMWWKTHQSELPLLASLARCVLCVPGTSVPSERVFSTAGDIVTSQRACLSPESVDVLIFLKHNMGCW